MKKASILLLLISLSIVAYNQESKVAIGLEFGPTITRLTGNKVVKEHDNRPSFETGLTFEYYLNDRLSLKSGLNYERKGTGDKMQLYDREGQEAGTDYIKVNYDYLVLPILFSYATKGKIKFYVNAGPYLAYLLSCKEISKAQTTDHKENTKKLDSGLSFGFGFTFLLHKNFLFDIGTRENIGLINVSKVDIIDNGSIRTMSFDLLFGLKYKF